MVKHIHALLLVALCSGILMLAVPTAHAEFREKGVAMIDAKGPNALMFDGHGFKAFVDRYMMVSTLTRFYDENGLPISLADLKIPCLAQIQYRKNASTSSSEAISVQVDNYGENRPVNTQFTLPVIKPEEPR